VESVDRSQRRARALRGAAAAAVATTVAATAHTLAGAPAPAAWLLVAVTLLAMPLAVALTGRRPSLWRTSAVVAVSQVLLHVAFATTAGTAAPGSAGHVHGAAPALSAVDAGVVAVDPAMVAGHVIAAAVTVALVTRGERALHAIAAGLHQLVRRVVVAAQPPAPRLRLVPLASAIATGVVAVTSVSRRGPPVLSR